MRPCKLWLDVCILPLQSSNLLSFVTEEPHCLWHGVPWSLGDICSLLLSTVHLVVMRSISNKDTHLYLPHNNSSVYLITYVKHLVHHRQNAEWLENAMRSHKLILLKWSFQQQHGSSLIASAPVRHFYSSYTNWAWHQCGLRLWCRGTDCQPCCPSLSHAGMHRAPPGVHGPDSFGWQDSQMAAQHLPKI